MPRPKKTTDPLAPPVPAPTAERAKYARVKGKDRVKLIASLKREYRSGKSIFTVAAEHNVSYGFVQRALSEAGVATRSRGGSKPKVKATK